MKTRKNKKSNFRNPIKIVSTPKELSKNPSEHKVLSKLLQKPILVLSNNKKITFKGAEAQIIYAKSNHIGNMEPKFCYSDPPSRRDLMILYTIHSTLRSSEIEKKLRDKYVVPEFENTFVLRGKGKIKGYAYTIAQVWKYSCDNGIVGVDEKIERPNRSTRQTGIVSSPFEFEAYLTPDGRFSQKDLIEMRIHEDKPYEIINVGKAPLEVIILHRNG